MKVAQRHHWGGTAHLLPGAGPSVSCWHSLCIRLPGIAAHGLPGHGNDTAQCFEVLIILWKWQGRDVIYLDKVAKRLTGHAAADAAPGGNQPAREHGLRNCTGRYTEKKRKLRLLSCLQHSMKDHIGGSNRGHCISLENENEYRRRRQ